MALIDEIQAQRQSITCEVLINGTIASALAVSVRHGADQECGQASVTFATLPTGADAGAIVDIWAGYNGETGQIFSGSVTGRTWDAWPTGVTLDCRDRLDRLRFAWGGPDRSYTSTTEGSVVQNLVEAMGIDASVTSIEDSGWTVGVTQTVYLRRGDVFLRWIREVDDLAGYVTFTRSNGAIYRRQIANSATVTWAFAYGTDLIEARRSRGVDGISNGVEVQGLTYEGLTVSAYLGTANADIPTPPGTVVYRAQSNLIETDARATIVATRQLALRNYRPETYQITTVGNPLIEVGHTITVTASPLGVTAGTAFVVSREHSIDAGGFTTVIHARKVP